MVGNWAVLKVCQKAVTTAPQSVDWKAALKADPRVVQRAASRAASRVADLAFLMVAWRDNQRADAMGNQMVAP